ncbi:MAG: penicillin-binding protein 2 [Hyphomicrobium sp.]
MAHDSEEQMHLNRRFTRRTLLLGAGQVAAMGALGARLYYLQVMDGRRYAPLADENRLSLRFLAPVRGRILDRNGVVLADNRESFRVLLQPGDASDIDRVLGLLGRIVAIPAETREQLVLRSRRAGGGAPMVVAGDLTFEQVAEINLLAPQLPGVETDIAYSRRYPEGAALGHVTGYVGAVERHALDDDPTLRLPGIRIGKVGLERGLDVDLRGVGGTRRREVDVRGRVIRILDESRAMPGIDAVSSIDVALQRRVMERLSRETRAACVVLDTESGEVVTMASYPSFNPNEVAGPTTPAAWRRLAEAEHQPILNRTVSGQYPPGSTLKIASALAALDKGVIEPRETITCTGGFTLAGQTYRCWKRHGHGRTNLHEALRESCDVYFYELATRLGIVPLASMFRRLGLGSSKVAGLVLDKAGIVPDPTWKRWRVGHGWATGDTVLAAIGQGYVLATPLQLAVMTARVATGRAVEPTLVRREGREAAIAFPSLGLAPQHLDSVRKAMVAVVNEAGGTGAAAQASDGTRVAGKTGTSQVRRTADADTADEDVPWELRDHALFVSYFPAEAPRYALAVVVEHGGGGGAAAAPLAKDVIDHVLAVDPVKRRAPLPAAPIERAATSSAGREG